MDVTSIRFDAFKSLYEVPCDLGHFTVVTGPNGAGKSNFVEALNFLTEVNEHGLELAVSRAGGYENIAHRRARRAKRPVAVSYDVRLDSSDLQLHPRQYIAPEEQENIPPEAVLTYRQRFSLRTDTQALTADFRVAEECVELLDDKARPILSITRGTRSVPVVTLAPRRIPAWQSQLIFPLTDKRYLELYSSRPMPVSMLISEAAVYGTVLDLVTRRLAQSRVFQLSPQECRRSGVPTPNASLDRYGSNLPAAADYLRKRTPKAWDRVQRAMRSIMPGLMSIEVTFTEDRRLTLQFHERRVGKAWTTGEVSDGTIQALALFVALYDERAPLLIVEEPENSIHPWILRQFLDLCQEHSEKQIVLTTHSPVLLDYVGPQAVRIMWREDGRSHLARLVDLDPSLVEAYLQGELSVFQAYDSGIIPQGVPAGYSHDLADDEDELD